MDAFYGEIRAFPFTFAPQDWLYCNGSQCYIQQYQALAAILGNKFGGNGTTIFGLPNLNGMIVLGTGQSEPNGQQWAWGEMHGLESVALTQSQMPAHKHQTYGALSSAAFRTAGPNAAAPLSLISFLNDGTANQKSFDVDPINASDLVPMSQSMLSPWMAQGNGHENRQPVLPLSWCICAQNGLWPNRT